MTREVFHHGCRVASLSAKEGLDAFADFIKPQKNVVLCSHNCRSFDARILLANMKKNGVELPQCVVGFCDTLHVLRKQVPGQPSYSLGALHSSLAKGQFMAHSAVGDVRGLCQVLRASNVTPTSAHFIGEVVTTASQLEAVMFQQERHAGVDSLQPLKKNGILSDAMIKRAAGSGLHMGHLKLAFQRDPEGGLRKLFSELSQGKPRVTKSSNIISRVAGYFQSLST